jgi:hypothetical protein
MAVLGAILLAAPGVVRADDAQPESASEYMVKAAFVYNFAKFVQWPAPADSSGSPPAAVKDPVNFCVAGSEAVYTAQQRVVLGKTLNGRPITVKWLRAPDAALRSCQILFIPSLRDERTNVDLTVVALGVVRNSSVLTVGDSPDFLSSGGIINFLLKDKRIRFEVNLAAARKARLTISSELLRLATAVVAEGRGEK